MESKGTSATRAKNKYNAKAYDHVHVTLYKGKKEAIDAIYKERGFSSRNEFIQAAIKAFIDDGATGNNL